jgi:hypothetical protein
MDFGRGLGIGLQEGSRLALWVAWSPQRRTNTYRAGLGATLDGAPVLHPR